MIRKDETRVLKKIFESEPENGRKVGRTIPTWLGDAENDI